jgi:hypothetical protein
MLSTYSVTELHSQPLPTPFFSCGLVKDNDAVGGQKISKFFVSHVEESMAGHMGMMKFIKS